MEKKNYKIQKSISGHKNSKLRHYQDLVVGTHKIIDLIKYEFITVFFSCIPGAFGIYLRSKFYPMILGSVGKGVFFGSNIVFRHPKKIFLGDNVIIDDNVLIDAKGKDNSGINIRDEVFIGRNSIISCKDGDIELGERVNVGFNCEIFSSRKVTIGKDTLIGAYSFIIGGGNYNLDNKNIPINQQPDFEGKGGVELEGNIWLGGRVTILDGVKIGHGSVIGAGSVVNKSIPAMSIAAGTPAKVIRER